MNDQFLKFYENIKLTSAQREDAIIKYDGVCKKLHDYYYPTIEYSGNTKLLIGSYGKHTHIRPARDIDVIFIMPQGKFGQYNDNQSNCQAQLLQDIKRILEEKYPNTHIRADEKVVTLEFADTQHDVELLPAWENDDATFKIPNSVAGGSWENWDPRSEIRNIKDSDDLTGKTKSLVRMVKKWSENCTAAIKSYKIEESVINYFTIGYDSDVEYSILVTSFLEYFYNSISDEDLRSHVLTALNRANKALDFEKNNKLKEAAVEWQKIFGNDFPTTIEKEVQGVTDEKIDQLYLAYPSIREQYLEKDFGIKTNSNSGYILKLDADVQQDGYRKNLLSQYLVKKFPLLKDKQLAFKIIKNTVPLPYSIKWKVRNFGDEAKNKGDLRGEIIDDRGYGERKEHTKYKGEHYVECYVIKNGVCVAQDKILVPVGFN